MPSDLLEQLNAEIEAREIELDALRKARDVLEGQKTTITEKVCPNCEQPKPISEFSRNRASKDGRSVYCSDCYKTRFGERKAVRRRERDAEKAEESPKEEKPAHLQIVPKPVEEVAVSVEEKPAPVQIPKAAWQKKRVMAIREKAREKRVALRCRKCGDVVLSHKASQHTYEAHALCISSTHDLDTYFERSPEDEAVSPSLK